MEGGRATTDGRSLVLRSIVACRMPARGLTSADPEHERAHPQMGVHTPCPIAYDPSSHEYDPSSHVHVLQYKLHGPDALYEYCNTSNAI